MQGQPGAARPVLLPGRRPSEGEAAGAGVAEVRALHRQGHEAGGHRIPGQAGNPGLKVCMLYGAGYFELIHVQVLGMALLTDKMPYTAGLVESVGCT